VSCRVSLSSELLPLPIFFIYRHAIVCWEIGAYLAQVVVELRCVEKRDGRSMPQLRDRQATATHCGQSRGMSEIVAPL